MKFETLIKDYRQFEILMQPYRSAVQLIQMKLESIDDELKCENGHSPIHNINSRIKSPESILDKLNRKKYPRNQKGMRMLNDIAGVRVICHYLNDTQYISQLLIMHEDITLIKTANYIEYPKESGYRSLHLVVKVPVHLREGKIEVPVEIQIRTIAMDCWASLEHVLLYKNQHYVNSDIHMRLIKCASLMAKTDQELQKIYQELNNE